MDVQKRLKINLMKIHELKNANDVWIINGWEQNTDKH